MIISRLFTVVVVVVVVFLFFRRAEKRLSHQIQSRMHNTKNMALNSMFQTRDKIYHSYSSANNAVWNVLVSPFRLVQWIDKWFFQFFPPMSSLSIFKGLSKWRRSNNDPCKQSGLTFCFCYTNSTLVNRCLQSTPSESSWLDWIMLPFTHRMNTIYNPFSNTNGGVDFDVGKDRLGSFDFTYGDSARIDGGVYENWDGERGTVYTAGLDAFTTKSVGGYTPSIKSTVEQVQETIHNAVENFGDRFGEGSLIESITDNLFADSCIQDKDCQVELVNEADRVLPIYYQLNGESKIYTFYLGSKKLSTVASNYTVSLPPEDSYLSGLYFGIPWKGTSYRTTDETTDEDNVSFTMDKSKFCVSKPLENTRFKQISSLKRVYVPNLIQKDDTNIVITEIADSNEISTSLKFNQWKRNQKCNQ